MGRSPDVLLGRIAQPENAADVSAGIYKPDSCCFNFAMLQQIAKIRTCSSQFKGFVFGYTGGVYRGSVSAVPPRHTESAVTPQVHDNLGSITPFRRVMTTSS